MAFIEDRSIYDCIDLVPKGSQLLTNKVKDGNLSIKLDISKPLIVLYGICLFSFCAVLAFLLAYYTRFLSLFVWLSLPFWLMEFLRVFWLLERCLLE